MSFNQPTERTNRLIYLDEGIQHLKATLGLGHSEAAKRINQELQQEVYIGIVDSVNYDAKTDTYVVKFNKSSAKIYASVAEFLIQYALGNSSTPRRPVIYVTFEKGIVTAATAVFISRD